MAFSFLPSHWLKQSTPDQHMAEAKARVAAQGLPGGHEPSHSFVDLSNVRDGAELLAVAGSLT